MTSMNTRLNIKKLDVNIVQKHGGSKQVGLKQLGVHRVQVDKRVWFEVKLQGAQGNREAEVLQVSNDNAAVGQRWLEVKQLKEKSNTDCLVKEQKKGNVAEKKKVKESMEANLGKLLKVQCMVDKVVPDSRFQHKEKMLSISYVYMLLLRWKL
nr:hypothetical protein [Tanacetum cinerariifolium]